jgi:hypothetical protein
MLGREKKKLQVKYSPTKWLVDALVEANDDFITELADQLMLDELLAGECDPKQFLIETMYDIIKQKQIQNVERRLKQLKEE